jgi:hypothetical protein
VASGDRRTSHRDRQPDARRSADADITRVRPHFADGHLVEGDPTNDVVVFIVNEPVTTHATIVLLGCEGISVASHPGFLEI